MQHGADGVEGCMAFLYIERKEGEGAFEIRHVDVPASTEGKGYVG